MGNCKELGNLNIIKNQGFVQFVVLNGITFRFYENTVLKIDFYSGKLLHGFRITSLNCNW